VHQFTETGNAIVLFSLLTVLESLAVFDVVVHGLKDFI